MQGRISSHSWGNYFIKATSLSNLIVKLFATFVCLYVQCIAPCRVSGNRVNLIEVTDVLYTSLFFFISIYLHSVRFFYHYLTIEDMQQPLSKHTGLTQKQLSTAISFYNIANEWSVFLGRTYCNESTIKSFGYIVMSKDFMGKS